MTEKTVFFVNVGCQKTNLDSLHARRYCEANGWRVVSKPCDASLICVGTCAVIGSMEDRSEALIESLLRDHPQARIAISGCLPVIKEGRQIFSRPVEMVPADASERWEKVVPPGEKRFGDLSGYEPFFTENLGFTETLAGRVKRYLFDFGLSFAVSRVVRMIRSKWGSRGATETPAYLLEISRGCLEECTYCVTRFARGRLRSRPVKEIVQEFSQASQQGFKKFILMASDTGCYGLDFGSSFFELLSALLNAQNDLKELVIPDFNVKWLMKDYARLLPLFIQHQEKIVLNAITQHVSDRLLVLMKRDYNSQEMVRCLRELRQKAPRLEIATNIIVGFPSESHEEFRQLIDFLKQIRFHKVLVYQYSARPRTIAAQLPNQVPKGIKLCRMLRLEATQLMIILRRGIELLPKDTNRKR